MYSFSRLRCWKIFDEDNTGNSRHGTGLHQITRNLFTFLSGGYLIFKNLLLFITFYFFLISKKHQYGVGAYNDYCIYYASCSVLLCMICYSPKPTWKWTINELLFIIINDDTYYLLTHLFCDKISYKMYSEFNSRPAASWAAENQQRYCDIGATTTPSLCKAWLVTIK